MRNRTENQIALVMIRHGATKSNREHRYLGRADEALCEEGIGELQRYKAQRRYPEVDRLFASPMIRCVQTAKILYPDVAPVRIPEWAEMDFGAFEGKNYMDLQGDERYQKWIDSQGTLPFPEGEGRVEFTARCRKGFGIMMERLRKEGPKAKTVGMIVHGGTIMALFSEYCGGGYYSYQAANATGYLCTCSIGCKGWQLTGLQKL